MFSLVVDDFGIRYTKRDDVEQLIAMLECEYKCTIHWEGNRYVGLTLAWDYDKGTCNISMPGAQDTSEEAFLWVLTAPLLVFKDSVLFSTESDNLIKNPTIIRRL
jgi:hypothetical protein